MKKLVVCGDSFAKGIGCRNLETEPYGSLVANSLGYRTCKYCQRI